MNELKHLNQFKEILKSYEASDKVKHAVKQTELVLMVAPSSSGRNTIIRQLLKTGDYHFVVSDTTRSPRRNDGLLEQNGVEYWFRTEEEFLNDLRHGEYLEAEVIHDQQVSGMSAREIIKSSQADKIAISDIDIGGVLNVLKAKPDAVIVLVLPPNFDEWLRRIKGRGKMSDDELHRRMKTAITILETSLARTDFNFVVNDSLNEAAETVNSLAKLSVSDKNSQDQARDLAERLLIQIRQYLQN